jgi:hypothetical protein
VILQGVAARVKRNQASSQFANKVSTLFQPCAIQVHVIAKLENGKL